jgi:hypothetical protein
MRAYVLAGGLVFVAAAAWAALPTHEDLTRVLDTRLDNPVIKEQATEVLRVCCKDDWEQSDRYGFIVLQNGARSSDFAPGLFTAGWNPAFIPRPPRLPLAAVDPGYTQPYGAPGSRGGLVWRSETALASGIR